MFLKKLIFQNKNRIKLMLLIKKKVFALPVAYIDIE
jgi:hypothetical protein